MSNFVKAKEILGSNGIRPSVQRIAVLEYLLTHRTHPTADMIYESLLESVPTLSRTTVYNTLGSLAGCGAILSLDLDPRQAHYDGDNSAHGHFLCTGCGKIEDVALHGKEFGTNLGGLLPAGAQASSIQLSFKGLCAKCNTNNQ